MLFHLKRNPHVTNGAIGYDWLDVLAIRPLFVNLVETPYAGVGEISCEYYARTPDGFTEINSVDLDFDGSLEGAKECDYEYYMAEKDTDE